MKRFYLITNKPKDPDLAVTKEITAYLEAHNATVTMRKSLGLGSVRHTDTGEVPEDTECILVLGGDGTLMRAANDLAGLQIPLLGVNLGTLGYLAEIDRASIQTAMDALLEDRYQIETRMLLQGEVIHEGNVVYDGTAVNDIVVSREGKPRVITLRVFVNDSFLHEYRADGLIVSSPTGSTGYSLSAGGPIIAPEAELFLMTPLAAHTLHARSVILPDSGQIRIEVGRGKDDGIEQALAAFDGEETISLVTGDAVIVRRAKQGVRILKVQSDSFLETLRRKMQ